MAKKPKPLQPLVNADSMRHAGEQQANAMEMAKLAHKMKKLAVKMRKESEKGERIA